MDKTAGNQPLPPPPSQIPQIVYVQPGQQAVYLQKGQHVPPSAPMPAPSQSAGQWTYLQTPVAPALQPSSGLRISAGILGIALGVWKLVMSLTFIASWYGEMTPYVGWVMFLRIVGAMAVLTLGIMIIINHRRRSRTIPAMLLGATLAFIVMNIAVAAAGWRLSLEALADGLPAAVLAALVLLRERSVDRAK